MTHSWSVYVIVIVVLNVVGCAWLLYANRKAKVKPGESGEPVGHEFDGIGELNNPLPAWWTWLFVVTIIFAVIYLALYPGLGRFAGGLGWTSGGQWDDQIADAKAQYGPIYARYFERSIPDLLDEPAAIEMVGRLFAINCSTCHGSDARGGDGYPNLTDDDWLYGGAPETIVQTITHGRNGMMPPMGAAVGGEPGIKQVAQYVLSLSGRPHDEKLVRLIERSRSPPRIKDMISLRKCSGWTNSGLFSKCSSSRSWYFDIAKKNDGSSTQSTFCSWVGQVKS
ncbi:MAG: c-type cytochrome, partial [Deltaproteobacteria bacterium]|nr:c-type cytochrome [Deltaproteobacteria bacterium]